MRNLVIKRRKTAPNGRKHMLVYVCDPMGQTEIHGNPCRLLGTVGNGDIAAFPVEESEVKLYVVPENMGKDTPCEYCCLPAGNTDVFLTGICQFSPFAGHPFHFDGNDRSVAKGHRRKLLLITVVCLVAAAAIGLTSANLVGAYRLQQRNNTPQVFRESGMEITLTQDFRQIDVSDQGFFTGFNSSNTTVYVQREAFADDPSLGFLSLEEYAQLVLSSSEKESGGKPTQQDGLTYYEYTARSPVNGRRYSYFVFFYKGPDAFWMVEFTTLESNGAALRPAYITYAKSVCFPDNAI